jgi:predicted MFS family arabinose efflux permease
MSDLEITKNEINGTIGDEAEFTADSIANMPDNARVTSRYSYYVLFVLFIVFVFSFIDRMVLSIVLDDVKRDIGVSDTYMGLLTGLAFALFYTIMGIPIARWADRSSRTFIISIGLTVWSVMTAASGFAQNFIHLALARTGVGVGEAACSPPSHSLISDYFPIEKRATALSIYSMGAYIGIMIAFACGGYIAANFGWRSVYFAVGLAGIPLALLVKFTVKELPRGYSDILPTNTESATLKETLKFIGNRPTYWLIVFAASIQSLSNYAILTWGPAFLGRIHHMPGTQIGWSFGLIVGVFGCVGAYLGGRVTDRLGAKDLKWYMLVPAVVSLCSLPFIIGFLFSNDYKTGFIFFIPYFILAQMFMGPALSMIQSIVKPNMRATASALLLFVLNLVGMGLGPFLVGILNDQFQAQYGNEGIRYSLAIISVLGSFSALLYYAASKKIGRDFANNN